MNPEEQTEGLYALIQSIVHVGWLSTALTVVIVFAFTAVVGRLVTKFLRRLLSHDNVPLPSSSIFVNIARVVVWGIGLSVVLASCFNVDVSAAITALGVGGIAISLGFQDTLSNLIGGLQVSITGLVKPGDHINVGGQQGMVHDVTWRHTTIENSLGERSVVPNSVINKTALTKLRPLSVVTVPLAVTVTDGDLDAVAHAVEQAAADAALRVVALEGRPCVSFSEVADYGYKGTLTFTVADAACASAAKDAAVRAIAPLVHRR